MADGARARTADATARCARRVISSAARRVKVRSSTRSAGTPARSRYATRCARVLVLPVPAPAITSSGPAATPPSGFVSPCLTASRWAALSESKSWEASIAPNYRTRLYGYPVSAQIRRRVSGKPRSTAWTPSRAFSSFGHDTGVLQGLEIRHPDVLGWHRVARKEELRVDTAVEHVRVELSIAVADAGRRRPGVEAEGATGCESTAHTSGEGKRARARALRSDARRKLPALDLLGDSDRFTDPSARALQLDGFSVGRRLEHTHEVARDPGLDLAIETDGTRRCVVGDLPGRARQRAYRPFRVCAGLRRIDEHGPQPQRPKQQEYGRPDVPHQP